MSSVAKDTAFLPLSLETDRRTPMLARASLITITFTIQNIMNVLQSQVFAGSPCISQSIITSKPLTELPTPGCCGLCCHQVEASKMPRTPRSIHRGSAGALMPQVSPGVVETDNQQHSVVSRQVLKFYSNKEGDHSLNDGNVADERGSAEKEKVFDKFGDLCKLDKRAQSVTCSRQVIKVTGFTDKPGFRNLRPLRPEESSKNREKIYLRKEEDQVREHLNKIDTEKFMGPGGLHSQVLREQVDATAMPLFLISERLWHLEEVPEDYEPGQVGDLDDKNFMKFKKGKLEVLPLESSNTRHDQEPESIKKVQSLQEIILFEVKGILRVSPCEADLQELVHQIDIIVNSKKVEWESKMKALEAKMDIQDQELANVQSKLDQKGQEVGLLQQKLEDLQKTKYEMVQNYETQLQALQSQFSKLRHSYEKLQSHHSKQKKVESREKPEKSLETPPELNNLYKKLEEFKSKSREGDKKGTICQNYCVYLDAQQKLSSEKCNLLQKQIQNYPFQISNKKQNQEEVITYGQHNSEKDEFIIEKLKATVNEIAINKRELEEENLKLQEDLKMYRKQCQNIEAGFSEMRNELQSRDALWRRIQLECQQLHTELLKIREYKDAQEIQMKHQSSCVQLTEQLENKITELLLLAQSQECQQEELNKIRNHLYRGEQSHCSEQERMKTEISDLTEELHQKEITIATIMERASLLEKQLKMELEMKDKLLAKQQLLDFQYKIIKSENTHLKEMVENQECKSCMSIDLSKKEHGDCIHKLEHDNVRLQNGLVKLQNDTNTSMLGLMDTYGETERSYQTHSNMQQKEVRTLQKQNIEEMEHQQTAMFTTSGYYRNRSPALYCQGNISGSKSDSTFSSHTLHRGHEKRIEDKSPSPPARYPLGFAVPFPEEGRTGSLLSPACNAEELKFSSSPQMSLLATTEKFLQEEEKHTREFEERLNSHLVELQRHSENTLQKYARIQQSRHT
ncbi:deuterosome assembly protein 1 [Indicator indicator]|uniref:deuterosome assembly protein 1 n=1 Tax=Indicator indicator TaxID=1002788 RepID=UPI0023DFBA30|nr:deuterosome assembly protein 1 [Indicator indicator]